MKFLSSSRSRLCLMKWVTENEKNKANNLATTLTESHIACCCFIVYPPDESRSRRVISKAECLRCLKLKTSLKTDFFSCQFRLPETSTRGGLSGLFRNWKFEYFLWMIHSLVGVYESIFSRRREEENSEFSGKKERKKHLQSSFVSIFFSLFEDENEFFN